MSPFVIFAFGISVDLEKLYEFFDTDEYYEVDARLRERGLSMVNIGFVDFPEVVFIASVLHGIGDANIPISLPTLEQMFVSPDQRKTIADFIDDFDFKGVAGHKYVISW